MIKQVEIKIYPDRIEDEDFIKDTLFKTVNIPVKRIKDYRLIKKSIDARSKRPFFILRYQICIDEFAPHKSTRLSNLKHANNKQKVVIVGAGPAGYFAAMELLEFGIQPIVLDRGKDVQSRRRDLRAIQQFGTVNPHSNYCFGEGGAGTYSDGKLYTRSGKRGDMPKVLELLVEHGAKEEILYDAHPHIGSNKLPGIVANIRKTIEDFGGEVHFNSFVVDFDMDKGKIISVITEDGKEFHGDYIILATGHSARDIYQLLDKKGIYIEAKDFALGVRIEHSQAFIDKRQYKQEVREAGLPASSYSLVCQVDNQGVFSFCMCPGGLVVPAATAPGEIVVNGMSLSRRDSPFANSGFVTAANTTELIPKGYTGKFGNLNFQAEVEKKMFEAGDGSQKAPAQRVADFVQKRLSPELNPTSYIPGLFSAPLHELLPDFIYKRLSIALKEFDKKMPGYLSNDANVIGTESRTSAPVKIPRQADTLIHPDISNLYPCGEGAGYAGGILSAAMDGQRVARQIAENFRIS
jgi:uncharacterized FAD-dependent dehydrogenase